MGGGPAFSLNPLVLPEGDETDNVRILPRVQRSRREYLRGLVDMGSNGIRFSISDLSPPTSRILPTIYVYRVGISLYDEQYDQKTGKKIPIPNAVIRSVVGAMLRFQIICEDLDVPPENIRILATEATRTATNSVKFRKQIQHATGLTVEMLSKEDEGIVGALGIASSFSDVKGLVMDLGGGSTQITWMIAHEGRVKTSPRGAISFPYGAAALTRKLADLGDGKSKEEAEKAKAEFRKEMEANFLDAFDKLEVPLSLTEDAKRDGGFSLYLSGGGFRGWGYLLLFQHQKHGHHYPISIINGFTAGKEDFEDTNTLEEVARAANKIFRVSDRRRAQVPAVAFLVNVLADILPHGIKEARFCQGGVREGVLFQELAANIRAQDPLEVATSPYARPSAREIAELMIWSFPIFSKKGFRNPLECISIHIVRGLANILFEHAEMSKESSSAAALYTTSTGRLSSAHGVSHSDRALLALILEERFEGELPPREIDFKENLRHLLTPEQVWWTQYIGRVAMLVSKLYPAGIIDPRKPRVRLSARWASDLGKKKNKDGLVLTFYTQRRDYDPMKVKEALEDHVGIIEKVGKKKNWIGGREGWGMAVRVHVEEEDLRMEGL